MYIKLNSDKNTFQIFVDELRNFENGLVFSYDIDKLSINISPSENIIIKVIELSKRENVTIKFVLICTGTEFDIEDWQTARRVYCGYFKCGSINFLKYDDFNTYSEIEKNNFYAAISFVFENNFELNSDLYFNKSELGSDSNSNFYNQIKYSKYDYKKVVFDQGDVYKYIKNSTERPRYVNQLCENYSGYYKNRYNIDNDEYPIFIKNIQTPEIKKINSFTDDYKSHYKIMFFDIETNGLPNKKRIDSVSNWPDIIQISWAIYKFNGEIIDIGDEIIKPDGFEISKDSEAVHGISNKNALEKGKCFSDVIGKFIDKLRSTNVLVGHNLEFDITVLLTSIHKYELRRKNNKHLIDDFFYNKITWSLYQLHILFKYFGDDRFDSNAYFITDLKKYNDRMFYCTMIEASNTIFKESKWPKLNSLYQILFNNPPQLKLHNSLNDVWITKQCFYELYNKGLVINNRRLFLLNYDLFREISSHYNINGNSTSGDNELPF